MTHGVALSRLVSVLLAGGAPEEDRAAREAAAAGTQAPKIAIYGAKIGN